MKRKSTLALWHWSQQLQRKAIAAWFLYALNRRRKTERYARASERYRHRLLTFGVTQWIKVASDAKAQRIQTALKYQTQSAHSVLQCVRRCALRWREVARERRAGLRGRPPSGSSARRAAAPQTGAEFPGTRTTEIWSSLARKLQIPDGAPQSLRPQPRRPDFLKSRAHSHPIPELLSTTAQRETSCYDALPRVPPPRPPSPPLLYRPSAGREHQDSSFTFLPSTCSEESLTPSCRRTHTRVDPASQTAHGIDSLRLQTVHTEDEALIPHSQLPSPGVNQQTCAHMRPALLPPSVFEKPRTTTSVTLPPTQDEPSTHHPTTTAPVQPDSAPLQPGQVTEKPTRRSQAHGDSASGCPLPPGSQGTVGATRGDQKPPHASLSDPGIRTEIVCLRDELRRFQELKSLQRVLEEQVSQAAGEDSSGHLSQLQSELTRTAQAVQANEPQIRAMAARIHQLLSRCS